MRKILLTLAILFALTSSCFAAATDVCDFDLKTFCRNYNHLINFAEMPQSAAIDENQIFERENSSGGFAVLPLKNVVNGNGTVIGVVLDQQGYIWKINLGNRYEKDSDDMATAIAITLFTIGLEKDECDALLDELKSSRVADMYFPSIDRCLTVDARDLDDAAGVGEVEISAHAD